MSSIVTIYKSEKGKSLIANHYESYIQALRFPVERMYLNTSFGSTHLLAVGPTDGKPLFLLQGGNCINPMTLSWFSPLTSQYRIYAPDTIGHPGFSAETRVSAKDNSFALWLQELMNGLDIEKCGFIGTSYGAGIILRLAACMPHKIDCAVLVSPAGIRLGSKLKMIKDILLPLLLFHATSSDRYLDKLTNAMSDNTMKAIDKKIIGDIFRYVKLEQNMPKLTEKEELQHFHAPTLLITGRKDIFFPERQVNQTARAIIPNLTAIKSYEMGHFPSESDLVTINDEISLFLQTYYVTKFT
ncbi:MULTISPECIES: alpha/beta fold hydrolase [Paenibacillus]|uniref:alpha/beta fold hydrolase n=1 Tax=Paenibacillus TaxID=44249 RepID=UPI000386031B|nr:MULTISPECIES: alpha/beta hydrolase [Paenibacillus]EPY11998.1 alpha/beta hydrolase fold protein [Paenibacillus alvei A6-6i-x]